MFRKIKEKLDGLAIGAICTKQSIKSMVTKKSEGVNGVVVAAVMLLVALVAVLLYWAFAEGVINKVFDKVNAAVDDLLN